jgi:signal transduction histidine kinase
MTAEEHNARGPDGNGWGKGSTAEHWMGCPLLDQQHQALGAIVIQSYTPEHTFSEEDQALFSLIANHVSNALQGLQSMDRLERAVHERTALLEQRNIALQEAQSELVRQEKLASLGRLVAGVAHEINTPLGICVTATSHLVQELKLTREELAAGQMTEDSLQQFFDIVDQSLRIMTTNTQRAAALVRSFKQVAVDQSSDDIRSFNLKAYLGEVLLSLQPKFKGRPVKVEIDCADDIVLDSFPGAVSQIVTNMLMNSLVHGYEEEQAGQIVIRAALEDQMVVLDYSDDGAGMDADMLAKLFDPFFTTKRGSGGSGLGAHILYNLVTGPLGGSVRAESEPGWGLRYHLRFPRSRRKEKQAA